LFCKKKLFVENGISSQNLHFLMMILCFSCLWFI